MVARNAPGWLSDTPACAGPSSCLADAECGEAHDLAGDQCGHGEDENFRGEHHPALRDCGEGGADHAGAVFGADGEHAQRADRDLRDVEAVEAGQGCIETVEALLAVFDVVRGASADERAERDACEHRHARRPVGGADAAQFRPLRMQHVAEADGAAGCGLVGCRCRADRGSSVVDVRSAGVKVDVAWVSSM